MKLRRRDIGAAIISIFLARIAWNGDAGPDSLSASVTLAFYSELKSFASLQRSPTDEKPVMADVLGGKVEGWTKTALPVPLDLDGDGTVEAIVIPSIVKNKTDSSASETTPTPQWGLRVLDLKPLHNGKSIASSIDVGLYPFHPRTIFTAGIDGPTSKNMAKEKETENNADKAKEAAQSIAFPVKMTTGQIQLASRYFEKDGDKSSSGGDSSTEHDRTRHYYCGTDWHDAANLCKVHCPGGAASECPGDQRCYADTPCDSEGKSNIASESFTGEDGEEYKLATTPGGTLPAVATLWSDGTLTMHALTKDVPLDPKAQKKKNAEFLNILGGEKEDWVRAGIGGLELRLLWKVTPFSTLETKNEIGYPKFNEVDVVLATDSPLGKHGTVIVGGKYRFAKDIEKDSRMPEAPDVYQSFHAVDAFTGEIFWSHGDGAQDAKDSDTAVKMNDMEMQSQMHSLPTTSTARRRSHIPTSSNNEKLGIGGDENDLLETESCLHLFRASVMDPESNTFPHLSWGGSDDTELVITHFDRKHRGGTGKGGMKQGRKKAGRGKGKPVKNTKRNWLKKAIDTALPFSPTRNDGRASSNKARASFSGEANLQYGKPNVILFRHREGISALSLRNGRSVCHLSLLEKSLYGDFNGDGVIDQIQFISDDRESRMNSHIDTHEFVEELARRVSTEGKDGDISSKYGRIESEGRRPPTRLCHAMALSGLPPREEIFGVPLCSSVISTSKRKSADRKRPGYAHHLHGEVYAAPPLLVEGSDGGNDVVFATSDGAITRYDGHGHLIWKSHGGTAGLPTWSGNTGRGRSPEYIGRIDYVDSLSSLPATVVAPHMRPIIVSGEEELAILTSGKGSVLARASFPQSAIERPILSKLSSDGTTDVVVVSADGMWGYKVTIERGGSGFLRVMVGLTFAGIALAALYNRYGHPPGADVRSTDD